MHLLHLYITKTLLHSTFSLWLAGLRPSLVNCSPLYIQTEGGNSWAKSFKRSFYPEVSHIKLQFPIHPSKMVVQRGSIKLCLKKLKPYNNMLVCLDLSGKTQLKQPCISTTDNPCIIINGKHPLKCSMEIDLISYFRVFGSHTYVFIPPQQWWDKLSPKAKEMIFIGYEPNTKGYHFWSTAQHREFISTHVLFDEIVFPFCFRNQTDGPASIPVEEERPTTYDKPSTEETQRNLEPSQDHYIQVSLGINNPNQDPPDAGHVSDHTWSSSSYPTWRTFLENVLDTPSPLCLDSPESSTSPPPYCSSPFHSPRKRAQLEIGHWSSISDRYQHKRQGIMNSPPSSSLEENIPSHGPKS